nr:sigma-70 family RNA polymerase sigma factor [Metabacillus halosaccharovorans]
MLDSRNFEEEIEHIYALYYLDVYKFLICFTGNRNEAEDLTQEVFIRVMKAYSKFNNEGKLKTWILSIAKHAAIDQMRKKKFCSIFKASFFNQIQSDRKSPFEILQGTENKKHLYDAISKLKPNYKAVVILRGINEFSIKETAEILGHTESKVKVDYHRAIQTLKKKLHINSEEVFNNAN